MPLLRNSLSSVLFSYFPITLRLKISKISKQLRDALNIRKVYYKIVSFLQSEFDEEKDITPYYHYFVFKYKKTSPEIIKRVFLSYLQERAQTYMITLSSESSLANEILDNIDSNIHLIVESKHFTKDNFNVMKYKNIKKISINNLKQLNQDEIQILSKSVINSNITELSLEIYSLKSEDLLLFIQLLQKANLSLLKFKLFFSVDRFFVINSNGYYDEENNIVSDEVKESLTSNINTLNTSFTNLRELSIQFNRNEEINDMKEIYDIICELNHLESISINHPITCKFEEFISIIKNNANIKYITIMLRTTSDEIVNLSCLKSLKKLEKLEFLKDIKIKNNPKNIKIILPNYTEKNNQIVIKDLKTITYYCAKTPLKRKIVDIINKENTILEQLNIICHYALKKEEKNHCPCSYIKSNTVKNVYFEGCNSLINIIPNLPSLQDLCLILENCSLSFDTLLSLLNRETMTEIRIFYKGCRRKYELSLESLKKLNEFVNLKSFELFFARVTTMNWEKNEFFLELPKLESLRLHDVNLYKINGSYSDTLCALPFESIFKSLKHMNKLRQLSITKCKLKKSHLELLSQQLKYLPLLYSLEIENEDKKDNSYDCIEEAIKDLKNLKVKILGERSVLGFNNSIM